MYCHTKYLYKHSTQNLLVMRRLIRGYSNYFLYSSPLHCSVLKLCCVQLCALSEHSIVFFTLSLILFISVSAPRPRDCMLSSVFASTISSTIWCWSWVRNFVHLTHVWSHWLFTHATSSINKLVIDQTF